MPKETNQNAKHMRFIVGMAQNGGDIIEAGLAAGYTAESSLKIWQTLIKRSDARELYQREQLAAAKQPPTPQAQARLSRKKIVTERLMEIVQGQASEPKDIIGASKALGSIYGWIRQTHIVKDITEPGDAAEAFSKAEDLRSRLADARRRAAESDGGAPDA